MPTQIPTLIPKKYRAMTRNGETTIREHIRETLREAGKPLGIYEIWSGVEEKQKRVFVRKRIYQALACMQQEGYVQGTGRGEARTYTLTNGGRKCST